MSPGMFFIKKEKKGEREGENQLYVFSVPSTADVTCTIPSVGKGCATRLTCDFNMDMLHKKNDIVVKYKNGSTNEQSTCMMLSVSVLFLYKYFVYFIVILHFPSGEAICGWSTIKPAE